MPNRSLEIAIRYLYNGFSISRGNSSPMTKRHRPSSVNRRAGGQTEYNLARNACRSSSKASHSNNVCWIVSDSRDSSSGHHAVRRHGRVLRLREGLQKGVRLHLGGFEGGRSRRLPHGRHGVPSSTSNASSMSRHTVSAIPLTKSLAFVPSRFSSGNSFAMSLTLELRLSIMMLLDM